MSFFGSIKKVSDKKWIITSNHSQPYTYIGGKDKGLYPSMADAGKTYIRMVKLSTKPNFNNPKVWRLS